MKLLKVLSLVIAAHALVFAIIMNPGCRSNNARPEPTATLPQHAGDVPTADARPLDAPIYSEPLNPATAPATPISETELPTSAPATAIADGPPTITLNFGRTTPTRPAAPEPTTNTHALETYTIASGDTLAKIAKKFGVTQADLTRENGITDPARLSIGQKLRIPRPGKTAAATTPATQEADTGLSITSYSVKSGDTLSKIAARHGASTAALRKLNNLSADTLKIGQVLKIPSPAASHTATTATPASPASQPVPTTATTVAATEHTVKSGETLGGIARRYKVSVNEISKANAITDPTKLRLGQKLVIPGATASAAAPQRPTIKSSPATQSIVPESPAQPVSTPVVPAFSSPQTTPVEAPVIPIEDVGQSPSAAIHSAAPLID